MSTTVLIADDSEVTRRGIRLILQNGDVEVVGEASSGEEAATKVTELLPDIVLLEVQFPGHDGFWALERIKKSAPKTHVIMYSVHDNPSYVAQAIALGASNYLSKRSKGQELITAVHHAVADEKPNGSSLMTPVAELMYRRASGQADGLPLTRREHQVLRLVALGLSNRMIGRCLEISVETVKEHVQNMLRKLDMRDRTEAAVLAVRKGIV
jgi:DNA-binding NarL/FixJ family response regulator